MIQNIFFHFAATVWVAMAVPLSVKTTTPAAMAMATMQSARSASTSRTVTATTTLRRASVTTTTNLPSTAAFTQRRAKLQTQLGREFNEDFFSEKTNLLKGKENDEYEISADEREVTEVEVIILDSEELKGLLKDEQKKLLVTSQSGDGEHVVQYFKYAAGETDTEDILSQEIQTTHQSSDAKSEGSILILLHGQSHDVQLDNDLDYFSPIEGDVEVTFIFNLLVIYQI